MIPFPLKEGSSGSNSNDREQGQQTVFRNIDQRLIRGQLANHQPSMNMAPRQKSKQLVIPITPPIMRKNNYGADD